MHFLLSDISKVVDKLIVSNSEFILVAGSLHAKYLKSISRNKRVIFMSPGHSARPKIFKEKDNYVFTATAWKEGKGLEDLLKTISAIKDVKLNIAGSWIHEEYYKEILSLVKTLKLEDRVIMLGRVSEEDLNKYYSKAIVAVSINNERGFGLLALEAASNGCPFIITEDSGAARYFKQNKDGFYFKYGDLNTLREYIQRLVNDKKLAYEMGQHAWQTVKNNYTWEKHARELLRMILEYKTS